MYVLYKLISIISRNLLSHWQSLENYKLAKLKTLSDFNEYII